MKKFAAKLIIFALFLSLFFRAHDSVFSQIESEQNEEVREINKNIQDKKDKINKMKERQKDYEDLIQKKQNEKASLNNQLAILENRMAKIALDIESAKIDIDRANLEIEKTGIEIQNKNLQILKQKEHIASVLKIIQKQDGKSDFEILLLNGSLNEFVNHARYLEDINEEMGDSIENLKLHKKDFEDRQKDLNGKKRELSELKNNFENKKIVLSSEQQNKNYLLEQTQYSEREYQRLLKLSKQEQQQAESDIVNLEKAARDKLSKIAGKALEFNDAGFIWPVSKNIIMSTFHDPEYPFRYIFEHPGVDIRAGQGSALRAAASGYVAIAKNAGRGYSYIMIVHGDGLATVYGHVSKIFVQADEYVVQGQAIGLTGGISGTLGAGSLTTGPHLHFEVRLNGVPIDPLEYLP